MAVTSTLSNYYKAQKATKKIDLENDVIKAYPMSGEFVFDPDNHSVFNDISGEILYKNVNPVTLTGVTKTIDNENDRVDFQFDDVSLIASGENIKVKHVCFVDRSTSPKTVIGSTNFGEMKEATTGQSIIMVAPILRES